MTTINESRSTLLARQHDMQSKYHRAAYEHAKGNADAEAQLIEAKLELEHIASELRDLDAAAAHVEWKNADDARLEKEDKLRQGFQATRKASQAFQEAAIAFERASEEAAIRFKTFLKVGETLGTHLSGFSREAREKFRDDLGYSREMLAFTANQLAGQGLEPILRYRPVQTPEALAFQLSEYVAKRCGLAITGLENALNKETGGSHEH